MPEELKVTVNEKKENGDITANANVSVGTEQVGEVAVTEKPTSEVVETKSLESAVEPKPSEGVVEVENKGIIYSKNENGNWVNTKTGNEVKGIGEKGKALIEELNAKLPIEKPTETRKEARIKIANALKDLLPKGADLSGLKKQGLSQDDIIDIIAKGAKELAKTGIEIDEAIRQVISKLKEHFEDFNIDEKAVMEKHFSEPIITDIMGALFNREIIGGIVSQSPYISASESTIGPLVNSQSDLGKAGANFIRSRVPFGDFTKTIAEGQLPIFGKLTPETGEHLAEKIGMHPEEVKPSELKIYPKGLKDNLLVGLPGWREDVLKRLYDEKYGSGKMIKDIDKKIEEIQNKSETESKKQKFLKGLNE